MRTLAEILVDVNAATATRDAVALQTLVGELSALGTPEASAHAARILAMAYDFTHDYHASIEHNGRAVALFTELGDRPNIARVSAALGSMYARTGRYVEALEHLHHALATYEELADRDGIAVVTGNIGLVYDSMGDFPRAMLQLHRALEMHEDLGDRYNTARVASNLGNVYWSTSSYPEALNLLHRALAIHVEDQNRRGIAIVTGNIGNVYHSTGDYVQALDHYGRALAMHEAHADTAHAARIMANMGLVHAHLHNDEEAVDLGRRACALHEQIGDRAGVGTVTGNIILSLLELGRDVEAAHLLDAQASMLMDEPETRAIHYVNRATLAERNGDLDAALAALHEALVVVTEAGIKADVALCHQKLRDLAQKRNDFAAYIEHNNAYTRITEEVRGKEATQRLAMMEAERGMEAERRERDKERALLYNTLPKSVADRMIRGEKVTGDHYDNASVIFVDIVGFTRMSENMAPGDVVQMLEGLFTTFDEVCERQHVMKIKTIGDSYMCVSFDSVVNAALCAVEMSQIQYTIQNSEFNPSMLQFRIGVHCGPVTAGVIGTQRLQYDVWGDTVNVASRMESSGSPGRIHVSQAFADNLKRMSDKLQVTSDKSHSVSHEVSHSVSHSVSHEVSHSVSHEVSHSVSHEVSHSVSHEVSNVSHVVQLVTRHLSLVTIPRGSIDIKGKGPMHTYWLSAE